MENQVKALLGQQEQKLLALIAETELNQGTLTTVFKTFYADCTWWVQALQVMARKAKNPRFRQALEDNIACETGATGNVAHTVLMTEFSDSVGLMVDMDDPIYALAIRRAQHENRMLQRASEAKKAGFMLGTESLFPLMLQQIRTAIVQNFSTADMTYIDEHITVDGDEHAIWMAEAVQQILAIDPLLLPQVLSGLDEAYKGAIFPFELATKGLVIESVFCVN